METFTVQEAKEQLNRLIKEVSADHRHFRITSQEGSIVCIPEETYENLLVTLEVLSMPGLMNMIKCEEDELLNNPLTQN